MMELDSPIPYYRQGYALTYCQQSLKKVALTVPLDSICLKDLLD